MFSSHPDNFRKIIKKYEEKKNMKNNSNKKMLPKKKCLPFILLY